MTLWRIDYSRHLDNALTGSGARLFGGRWNRKGTAVVYLSTALSLAAFEKFVYAHPAGRHDTLLAVEVEIPDTLIKKGLQPSPLPGTWRSPEPDKATMQWGSDWVTAHASLAACVPSVLLPLDLFVRRSEFNVMLNPEHRDMTKVRVTGHYPYSFDPRMWKDR